MFTDFDAIDKKYKEKSVGERLGRATSSDLVTTTGVKMREFEGGVICWSPHAGVHVVFGEIRDRWILEGGVEGSLGCPLSDEIVAADKVGVLTFFENGSIYFSEFLGVVVRTVLLKCLKLHAKVLAGSDKKIATLVRAAATVFLPYGVDVKCLSQERINIPELADVDVGRCRDGIVTTEMQRLFDLRDGVGEDEIAFYCVRSTDRPSNGCGLSPRDQPSVIVVVGADRWSLAHELGHLLQLVHISDNLRLMFGGGTSNISDPPPDLSSNEANTIRNNRLTHFC